MHGTSKFSKWYILQSSTEPGFFYYNWPNECRTSSDLRFKVGRSVEPYKVETKYRHACVNSFAKVIQINCRSLLPKWDSVVRDMLKGTVFIQYILFFIHLPIYYVSEMCVQQEFIDLFETQNKIFKASLEGYHSRLM